MGGRLGGTHGRKDILFFGCLGGRIDKDSEGATLEAGEVVAVEGDLRKQGTKLLLELWEVPEGVSQASSKGTLPDGERPEDLVASTE